MPEVSLIFDKPMPQSLNGSINSSPASLARPIQPSGNTAKCVNYTSPSTTNQNSYATWREQNYPKKTNSPNVKHVSPLYKKAPNYTCVSQSNLQDKICDIQRPINVKPDSGICEKDVKSMRLDANNSYNRKQEDQLSSNKRHLLSHNSVQTATSNITDYTTRLPSNHIIVDAVKKDAQEHLQIPYTTYPYPFQPFYPPNYPNRDIDNNETVRTLLQLVNNQNEQIKTLQLQIDRLVRMQEESFRNKAACTCLLSHTNQMLGYPHSYNATSALNSAHLQSHDQNIKINGSQSAPVVENKDLESLGENKDNSKLEVAMVEQQLKKTFVEQKVSIGVMTSFEFAVQNGPLLTDSETHDEKEAPENGNNRLCAVNMYDSTESIPRYKNTLACKPGAAQLENIVEDNESYLSSSQQQSSHFNANSSMRDSDRYTPKQSDPYIMNTAENPKIYQRFATDTHKKNLHEGMYVRTHNGTDERMQDAGNVFMNAECGSTENATGGKAFIDDTNDNVMIDGRKGDYKANVNRQLHNIHLPAKHYQNYRNREYDIKQHTQVTDVDGSMTLSARNLKILERPLTPEPSIHVEMQDYSSDDSSDDKPKQTPKIGWTFYNNVLDQVNEILQKSDNMDDVEQNDAKAIRKVEQENDTVKAATLEQLKKLGISLPENDEHRELNDNNKTYVSILTCIKIIQQTQCYM